MFVRHRSGPLYYMYIGFNALPQEARRVRQPNMTVHDIVVDDHGELPGRRWQALRAEEPPRQAGRGGGAGSTAGARRQGALIGARKTWNMDLCEVSYDDLGKRIEAARHPRDRQPLRRCRRRVPGAARRLAGDDAEFVARAFLLDEVFRNLLDEAETDTLTVNSCMSTIMPISETTVPPAAGSLLTTTATWPLRIGLRRRFPPGFCCTWWQARPVFFCNPSLPHRGIVTVSHCTPPRRMDGQRLERVRI